MRNRKLNRLSGYNYSAAGAYYVTLCTKNKEHFFGEIAENASRLNEYGLIADECWKNIIQFYSNIRLDEYVIMPNHVHAIIFIDEDQTGTERCSVPTNSYYGLISKIVKSYKEAVTKQIRCNYNNYLFGWQRSFYDHIIRDEKGLLKIREYIKYNPLKWSVDKDKIDNLEIV